MRNTEQIFNSIVKEYQEPVYWYIRRMVVRHEDAQDILQDTFVRVYRHLWQLRDELAMRAWIYRIATGEVSRFFRKNRLSVSEEISQALEADLEGAPYVDYTREAEIKLQKAILTLSPQQRTVFNLRYYDEMDYAEISSITGSAVGTLKVAYHNAREKIERYLETH